MNIPFYLLLFTIIFNALLYLPLAFQRQRAKRQRGLQEARAEIAACCTAFQKYLRHRHIVCGQLVHDLHYEAINSAQFFEQYVAIWPLLTGSRRQQIKLLRRRVETEMETLPSEIKKISHRFASAYLRAVYYKHPARFGALVMISLLRVVERAVRHRFRGKQDDWNAAFGRLATFWRNARAFDAATPVYAFAALWFIAIGVASFDAGTLAQGSAPVPAKVN